MRARAPIEDPENDVLVSVVSLWEIADTIEREGLTLIGIGIQHLPMSMGLPMRRRDLFDHLSMAQSIVENAAFVSDNRHVAGYKVEVVGSAISVRTKDPKMDDGHRICIVLRISSRPCENARQVESSGPKSSRAAEPAF